MSSSKTWGWAAGSFFLAALIFQKGGFLFDIGFICALVSLAIFLSRKNQNNKAVHQPVVAAVKGGSGFAATHSHDNVAINADAGQVWVRDRKIGQRVLDKSDIRSINYKFEETNGRYRRFNRIDFHLSDLNTPIVTAWFQRHNESLKWLVKKNEAEAEEWFRRLSAFLELRSS